MHQKRRWREVRVHAAAALSLDRGARLSQQGGGRLQHAQRGENGSFITESSPPPSEGRKPVLCSNAETTRESVNNRSATAVGRLAVPLHFAGEAGRTVCVVCVCVCVCVCHVMTPVQNPAKSSVMQRSRGRRNCESSFHGNSVPPPAFASLRTASAPAVHVRSP